jgi:hypothetical protein
LLLPDPRQAPGKSPPPWRRRRLPWVTSKAASPSNLHKNPEQIPALVSKLAFTFVKICR